MPGVKGAKDETDTTWITLEWDKCRGERDCVSQTDPSRFHKCSFLTHRLVRRGAMVEAYIGEIGGEHGDFRWGASCGREKEADRPWDSRKRGGKTKAAGI
jgi:hypothetical protein